MYNICCHKTVGRRKLSQRYRLHSSTPLEYGAPLLNHHRRHHIFSRTGTSKRVENYVKVSSLTCQVRRREKRNQENTGLPRSSRIHQALVSPDASLEISESQPDITGRSTNSNSDSCTAARCRPWSASDDSSEEMVLNRAFIYPDCNDHPNQDLLESVLTESADSAEHGGILAPHNSLNTDEESVNFSVCYSGTDSSCVSAKLDTACAGFTVNPPSTSTPKNVPKRRTGFRKINDKLTLPAHVSNVGYLSGSERKIPIPTCPTGSGHAGSTTSDYIFYQKPPSRCPSQSSPRARSQQSHRRAAVCPVSGELVKGKRPTFPSQFTSHTRKLLREECSNRFSERQAQRPDTSDDWSETSAEICLPSRQEELLQRDLYYGDFTVDRQRKIDNFISQIMEVCDSSQNSSKVLEYSPRSMPGRSSPQHPSIDTMSEMSSTRPAIPGQSLTSCSSSSSSCTAARCRPRLRITSFDNSTETAETSPSGLEPSVQTDLHLLDSVLTDTPNSVGSSGIVAPTNSPVNSQTFIVCHRDSFNAEIDQEFTNSSTNRPFTRNRPEKSREYCASRSRLSTRRQTKDVELTPPFKSALLGNPGIRLTSTRTQKAIGSSLPPVQYGPFIVRRCLCRKVRLATDQSRAKSKNFLVPKFRKFRLLCEKSRKNVDILLNRGFIN